MSIQTDYLQLYAADQVSKFLRRHPEFLERYITEEVEFSKLQKWTARRSQRQKRNPTRSTSSVRKYSAYQDKDQMLQDLAHKLQLEDTKEHTLWDLANCLCSAAHADGFRYIYSLKKWLGVNIPIGSVFQIVFSWRQYR